MTTHLSSTRTAAFAVDAEQRITEWNESAVRSLGHSKATAVGKRCWALLQGRDAAGNRYCRQACMLCRMAIAGEAIGSVELSYRHADSRWVGCRATILVDDGPADLRIVHLLQTRSPSGGISRRARKPGCALTARELDVLDLLDRGKANAEIAGILSIAPSTVRTHVEHILCKLGTHSRLGAVAEARHVGLLR